jgi:putative phosphoesterase
MKVIVTGNIKGNYENLLKVLKQTPEYDLHLDIGDIGLDIKQIDEHQIITVKGNNDVYLELSDELIIEQGVHRLLIIHGHQYDVKYGLNDLIEYAKQRSVDFCIFGHAQAATDFTKDGIRFIAPGTLSDYQNNTYAIIDDGNVSFERID